MDEIDGNLTEGKEKDIFSKQADRYFAIMDGVNLLTDRFTCAFYPHQFTTDLAVKMVTAEHNPAYYPDPLVEDTTYYVRSDMTDYEFSLAATPGGSAIDITSYWAGQCWFYRVVEPPVEYTRNVDCWAYPFDLTCISPWNSPSQHWRAGTLVSPKHIIFAAHYPLSVGSVVRFVTQGNVVVERTLTAVLLHPDYVDSSNYPDLAVGVLDSIVPGTITFAKVLPADWKDYFPPQRDYNTVPGVPVMVLDQEEKALIYNLSNVSESGPKPAQQKVYTCEPQDVLRSPFYEVIVSGDSGNPMFMVIDGELVILTVITGGESGTDIQAFTDDINARMTALGGGYQLTPIDLSKYATL